MQATGNNSSLLAQQSIRVVAGGLSFFPGSETIVVCGPSTRMPMSEFRREEAAMVLDYVLPPAEGENRTVLYNVLPELEVVELFAIDTTLLDELRQQWPVHRIVGVNSMVLERMWRHDRRLGQGNKRLYVYCHDDEMLVFAYNAAGLWWANTFHPTSTAEAVYFILMAWRTLHMDVEGDECFVIGNGTATANPAGQAPAVGDIVQSLNLYLRHAVELTHADVLGQSAVAEGVPFDVLVV